MEPLFKWTRDQVLWQFENSLLLNYNIKLDIGRVHNKQKILSHPSILDKIPLVTTSESSLDLENSFDSTRSLSSSVFM